MKKFFDKVLPFVWGFLWLGAITVASVGILVCAVKWLLSLMGVL